MTEEEQKQTNWSWSVAGIAIRDGKVLLARHTYGSGNGKLIIPGGYCLIGETPQDAVKREFKEETGIEVCPENLVGLRFSPKDWYAVFSVRYISGEARSDHEENNEVVWIETKEALQRADVPELTKELIQSALNSEHSFPLIPYKTKHENNSLYACKHIK
jgi:ADP-ribose pyrophosphatase YjhB (NUDIX family)